MAIFKCSIIKYIYTKNSDRNRKIRPAARGNLMFFDKISLILKLELPSDTSEYYPCIHYNLHCAQYTVCVCIRIPHPSVNIPCCMKICINKAFTIIKRNIEYSINSISNNKT